MAEGGYIGVNCRVNKVVKKLKDCEELHGIMRDGSSEERSDLLSTLRKMVSGLETGLKRVRGTKEESGMCTHKCLHHPEIMNPELWRKLPEDLVALVFARLPIPLIVELRKSSEVWAALSESTSFRGAFVEANPNLFGLLGWRLDAGEDFRAWVRDAGSKEWHGIKLNFPKGQEYKADFPIANVLLDSFYACDGGLVCVVPGEWDDDDRAYVGNPLTDTWRHCLTFGNPSSVNAPLLCSW